MSDQPDRLTLDSNLLHDLWKDRAGKQHVERLLQLADAGTVDLAVTTRIQQDIPYEPLASRIRELPELGISTIGSVFRLDISRLDGGDMVGSDDFVTLTNELSANAQPGGRLPDWRDLDHVHGHMLKQRDIFLTNDKPILELADQLHDRFEVLVMTPKDYLERHDRRVAGS